MRGLGAVTGESSGGSEGLNTSWINQNGVESDENTNQHQNLLSAHQDLHDEIEGNDLNPKDSNKKVKVVNEK